MGRKQAELVGSEVRSWYGLVTFSSELEVLARVQQPVAELPLFKDGLLCRKDTGSCQYVCRNEKMMKEHWYTEHGWSIGGGKGRQSRMVEEGLNKRFQEAVKQVHCQRFFPTFHGSQYFEEELEKRARATIEDGEKDEVSPWLDRTQWLPYLARLDRDDLLASVEEPNTTNNPDRPEEEEPAAAAIWKAMDEVTRIGQQAVTQRVGIFIRMELMRTEKHQNRYYPLQPYMEENAVADRSRAWKQVLMFFVRT
ncbi:uncharacterized protein LTHEOB_12917 [Neofusicoccum parvum]|nr:uncharacterized protein LTHEOB_12917 [Neofusicoccum parvum]